MKYLVSIFVVALMISGCANTRNTRVTINTSTGETAIVENHKALKNSIDVIGINYTEVEGLKKAIVTIRSNEHKRLTLQARVSWLDEFGSPISEEAAVFKTFIIDGGEEAVITGMAPHARAVKAIVRIRRPEDATY